MKIAVGGQMDKQEIANRVEKLSDNKINTYVLSDIEASMGVKNGNYDYYLGACATGAGAALAMAIGILGGDKCASLSRPGNILGEEEISKIVDSGVKAFGFVNSDAERILPVLVEKLLKNG